MLALASLITRHSRVTARGLLQTISQYSKSSRLVGRASWVKWSRMAATKVIIDTDPGTDDALALFMALEAHQRGCVEVLAITTVHGNTSLHNVNNNIMRILRLVNMLQVPVYSGASQSLVHPWNHGDEPYHGEDGFGDADLTPQPPAATFLQPRHAVTALLDLVKQHSGEVVLVALGPLTNLALALRLDPAFTSHLAALYIMGGNTTGKGKITPSAEFNFCCDPEAALVVLRESSVPIRLTTWEMCAEDGAFPFSVREKWGQIKSPIADLMNKIEGQIKEKHIDKNWVTCDQLAMAWVIDDAKHKLEAKCSTENGLKSMGFLGEQRKPMVTATRSCYASVETGDDATKGQMLIDDDDSLAQPHNMILMEAIDVTTYMMYLSMAFGDNV